MRILLAEDARALSVALAKALRALSHTVDCVYDGYQALDKLSFGEYDCFICERILPRLGGDAVAREAKKRNSHIRTICFLPSSAYKGEDVFPFDVALPKPFGIDTLLEVIGRLESVSGVETYGFVTLDYDRRELFYKGKAVNLTLPELDTTKSVVNASEPVAAWRIAAMPLATIEGNVYRTIAYVNAKLERAKLGLRLVSMGDKGYGVNYD